MRLNYSDVHAAYFYNALGSIPKTRYQACGGRLSAARGSDKRDRLTGFGNKGNII